MAGTDGRDDELDALLEVEGVDTAKVTEQVIKAKGGKVEKTAEPPKPPDTKPLETPKPPDKPEKTEVPNPEEVVNGRLKEIFGDRFTTFDEFKKADIPARLQELETLRQRNKDLETQVKTKPKHHYASDDIAKFDEFVRATNINDAGIFNKLNSTDIANMDDMDALVLNHIVSYPSLAGKEPQVRKYFETKYNVDPRKVEAGDITQDELEVNQIGIATDGAQAKTKLSELKSKIKMPEIPVEEEIPGSKKWTPEEETSKKKVWSEVDAKIMEQFGNLAIPIKGAKEPIINFVLPEETKTALLKNALDYTIGNQMEVNENNVKSVAEMIYTNAVMANLDEIMHTVFERARSMTEEEYLKTYHNPSSKNTDAPTPQPKELTDEEKRDKAFNAEFDR